MNGLEIKEKRKALGLTQKALAEKLGVSFQTLNGYENGKQIPSTKYQILEIVLNQPSQEYSNTAQVEINNNNEKITTNNNEEVAVRFVKPIKKEIPFFDIDFYCSFKVENRKNIQPSFIFYHPDFDRAEFAVRNSGNSMSVVLGNRDIIGMREVYNWDVYFPQGEIYGIVTNNDMRTVRVVKESTDKTKFMLIPNPKEEYKNHFPEFEEIAKENVLHLFQVVAKMCSDKMAM